MTRESQAQSAAHLRALTYRISSTPAKQLPYIAPQIDASLRSCRSILSLPADSGKANIEATQTANRFRSTVSQLLQARTVEERWAAVVLAKAAVEAGGRETVSKSTGWTKNLIAILKKNDPSSTKALAILTVTRIFMLTWEDTNLVREITTPVLPGFVQACLSAADKSTASAQVLRTTLEAFATLLPRHPTVFRTFESQLRALTQRILSSTGSTDGHERYYTAAHHDCARRLLVLLHHCAAKQTGPQKWEESVAATLTAAHSACDRVFRSVHESWKPEDHARTNKSSSGGEVQSTGHDTLGLAPRHGLHAGVERIVTLLRTLEAHVLCQTSGAVAVQVGQMMALAKRVLAMNDSLRTDSAMFNVEISKDEREALFNIIPAVHAAALGLLRTLLERLGHLADAVAYTVLETLSTLPASNLGDVEVRTALYQLLGKLLVLIGPSIPKAGILDLAALMSRCCKDVSPAVNGRAWTASGISNHAAAQSALTNSATNSEKNSPSPGFAAGSELEAVASTLLPMLFTKLNQSAVSSKLRTEMEQATILSRNKDALVAAALNPSRRATGTGLRPSILPFLARLFPDCAEVEALLRPRMPAVDGHVKPHAEANGPGSEADDAESSMSAADEDDDVAAHEDAANDADPTEDGQERAIEHNSQPAVPPSSGAQEVYSTAPEQLVEIQNANKRPAEAVELQQEASVKRLRASPVAAALDLSTGAGVPELPVPSAPVTAVVPGSDGLQMSTLPADQMKDVGLDDGDDDSDFEIPPLTMDSDSEDDGLEAGNEES